SIGLEPSNIIPYYQQSIKEYIKLEEKLPFLTLDTLPFIILFIVSIGALLPDLDHHKSYISRKIKIISFFTGFLKHRGPTHRLDYNILFFGFFSVLTMEIFNNPILSYIIIWLGIGSILHIYGDMHTKSGVKLFGKKTFYVLPKKMTFVTNSPKESMWFGIYITIFFFIMFYQYNLFTVIEELINNFK
ncbi:metal-dependent hydrolase, partial [bacterium]|nr:metal-dependent hydrolase [bacterium]